MGDLGDKTLIPLLKRASNNDKEPEVREAASEAIELIEGFADL